MMTGEGKTEELRLGAADGANTATAAMRRRSSGSRDVRLVPTNYYEITASSSLNPLLKHAQNLTIQLDRASCGTEGVNF